MRVRLFICLLFVALSFPLLAFSFSGNYIEFNLSNQEIKLVDFDFGNYRLSGDFSFSSYSDNGSLISEIEGRNVVFSTLAGKAPLNFKNKAIPWLALKTVKQGNVLFIEHLSLPEGLVKGSINLTKGIFSLEIDGGWYATTRFLQGNLKVFAKAWGNMANFSLSGHLTIDDGVYKGREFSHIRLDLLGKPPVLNITDSEFILPSGTVATLVGDKVLDLRNLYSYIPGAEYRAKKAYIDEWQLFSEDKKRVGLKKNLDENIDVSLGADKQEESPGPETELRYKMKDDNFLKLKMQNNSTVIGLEKRKDF